MLDAIHFEETGKPAVVVATSHFVQQASSLKQSMHLEDLPLVVVSHPLGEPEVAAAKAQAVAADIVKSVIH
jgi:precorrin isomerase